MNTNSGFGRVTRDVLDLVELQMQLLSVDSQEAKRKAVRAILFAAVGATLAGSALTTAMVGGGFLLHELADWTVGASLLTIAAATLALVIVLLVAAMHAVKTAAAAMSETKSELAENLKWIKAVIISPQTSPRNQLRSENFPESAISVDRRFSTDPPIVKGR